ncbi:MAG: carbohydrate-binding protein [Caldilineaceae bacterium]
MTVEVLPGGQTGRRCPVARAEAENYKLGGEGVGYHDLTFGNFAQLYRYDGVDLDYAYNEWTGYSLVHMDPGEWTAYDVAVSEAGVYALTARVAGAMAGGVFHVELDGADISGPIVVPYTNDGLRIYTDVTTQTPALAAGNHELRIVIDQAPDGADQLFAAVNYLDFVRTGSAQTE